MSKGQAAIRDIFQILNSTYFGPFYFEAVKLLRESLLINVITHNLEVSLKLTDKEVKQLYDLDIQLLRGCLNLGAKSSRCLILLELGLVSLPFILKKKRVLFLQNLLTTNRESLVSKVFHRQILSTRPGDFISQVRHDLKELSISLSFSEIADMSKFSFKAVVNKAVREACFVSLCKEKSVLSKGREIEYESLETQPYLKPESKFSPEEMKRIFQIRSREIFIKSNFPSAFKDVSCFFPGCPDNNKQSHLYDSSCFSGDNEIVSNNVNYSAIFSRNISEQKIVMQIFFTKLEKRAKFLTLYDTGSSKDPRYSSFGIQRAKQMNPKKCVKYKTKHLKLTFSPSVDE